MQTRRQSLTEAVTNTVIGGAINWVIVFACVSLIRDPAAAASASVVLCTVHSLLRGYVVRRTFARQETR
jgi:hypothetical protein